jgi:argininosuccinate lyase
LISASSVRIVGGMWTGRFQQATDAQVRAYGESVSFDWRLYKYDIAGSIAHAGALQAAGLITPEEFTSVENGLRQIEDEIDRGQFTFRPELEDVHMNIESALTARIGPAGAKLHTARSRNDQVALDLRLYLRAEIVEISAALRQMQRALVELGARHADAFLPGYTHLQRAQPVLFAHHLLAYVEMFARDLGRFADTAKRLDVLPLGAGALAGSTITLDRQLVAGLLGFARVSENSMDAVSDRDFACEFLAAAAVTGMHLSRLSEDVILWSTTEFHFLTLSDAFTTGSSLMPQKKNPDVAELTRGKTGRLYGNLFRLLTVLKGLPMTYNRDLQEDKEAVFDSVDTLKAALHVFAAMLPAARVETAAMEAAAADPNLLATDLADYLVLKGVPFRQAHEVIGKLVALCLDRQTGFKELALADYQAASPAFDAGVYDLLDVRRSLASRQTTGSPSFANVAARLAAWRESLDADQF